MDKFLIIIAFYTYILCHSSRNLPPFRPDRYPNTHPPNTHQPLSSPGTPLHHPALRHPFRALPCRGPYAPPLAFALFATERQPSEEHLICALRCGICRAFRTPAFDKRGRTIGGATLLAQEHVAPPFGPTSSRGTPPTWSRTGICRSTETNHYPRRASFGTHRSPDRCSLPSPPVRVSAKAETSKIRLPGYPIDSSNPSGTLSANAGRTGEAVYSGGGVCQQSGGATVANAANSFAGCFRMQSQFDPLPTPGLSSRPDGNPLQVQ